MYKCTAASKTLPINTYVKVENLDNGMITVVRINDRGPFIHGRIIDLSYQAAKEVDLIKKGVANVRITVIDYDPKTTKYASYNRDNIYLVRR
jgi:rare lipoprotein A